MSDTILAELKATKILAELQATKLALKFATRIIKSYQSEICNSKEFLDIDLVEKGFCQGSIYTEALKDIENLYTGKRLAI